MSTYQSALIRPVSIGKLKDVNIGEIRRFVIAMNVLDLPREVLTYVLDWLEEDLGILRIFTSACRVFRSLVTRIRVPPGRVLRVEILRWHPEIRTVQGPILLSNYEELPWISRRLEGDLRVLFPRCCEKDPRKKSQGQDEKSQGQDQKNQDVCWRLESDITASLNPNALIGTVIFSVLEVVRKRVAKYPSREVQVTLMGRGMEVRWVESRCYLHIPVCVGWEGSRVREEPRDPMTSELRESCVDSRVLISLATFLSQVPITNLSYLPYIVYTKSFIPASNHLFYGLVLSSPVSRTLTHLFVHKSRGDPLMQHIALMYHNSISQDFLPSLQTIEFYTPVGWRGEDYTPSRQNGENFYLLGLPSLVRHRITSILEAHLVFPCEYVSSAELLVPASVVLNFPNVSSWDLMIVLGKHAKKCRTWSYPLHTTETIQELANLLASEYTSATRFSDFLSFWEKHRSNGRKFRVWCWWT